MSKPLLLPIAERLLALVYLPNDADGDFARDSVTNWDCDVAIDLALNRARERGIDVPAELLIELHGLLDSGEVWEQLKPSIKNAIDALVATQLNRLVAPARTDAQRASADGDIELGEAGMAIAIALDFAAWKRVPVPAGLLHAALVLADKGAVHQDSIEWLRAQISNE